MKFLDQKKLAGYFKGYDDQYVANLVLPYGLQDNPTELHDIPIIGQFILIELPNINLKANLAFTTFLGQTYLLSPYLKKNKIPFVFMLYPGGSFGLNNDISNNIDICRNYLNDS